jgi:hypothetical protein
MSIRQSHDFAKCKYCQIIRNEDIQVLNIPDYMRPTVVTVLLYRNANVCSDLTDISRHSICMGGTIYSLHFSSLVDCSVFFKDRRTGSGSEYIY